MSIAKECIQSKKNVLQALEILLSLDFDNYFSLADDMVSKWHQDGCYDSYYYFDIVATFPKEHEIRRQFFDPSVFEGLMSDDGWGQNSIARQALLRVNDQAFKEYLGDWLNKSIESGAEDDVIENEVIPLLVEFGEAANKHVSINNLNYIKEFVQSYLNKDQAVVEHLLNFKESGESDRTVWVADNVAYWSWMLGWQDVIESLKNKEWYWVTLFSDLWVDEDNNNLVVWSMCHDDVVIKNRAVDVMEKGDADGIDGVIAWERCFAN